MTEGEVDNFVCGIYHTSSIATTTYCLVGKGETLELLKVGLEELQRMREEVKALASHRESLREGEGILDRQTHIRHAKLRLHGTVTILHGRMHDALRMDEHLYPIGINTEEPLSLDNLKALVHHRGRVDCYLCAHIPCRMLEGIGCCHGLHLLKGELTERTARSREKDFLNLILMVAHKTLEDCRMFRINRKDRCMILLCKSHDKFSCHNEGFLVGKTNLLTSLYSMDCWVKTSETHHGGEYHVDRFSLYDIAESLCTGIDLDVRTIVEESLQLLILILIGDDHGSRTELTSLLGKQFHLIISSKTVSLKTLAVLFDDFKSLSAY